MKPVYLLVGAEFLSEEALDRLRDESGADPLAEAEFDPSASGAEMLTALGSSSLLGGTRMVVVRDADGLKKEQVEALTSYLAAPAPDVILVLLASGRTKLDAAVKPVGDVIAMDAPKGRRLVGWLRQRATGHGLKLDDRGGWALIDAVGTELRDLDAALQQLALGLGRGAIVAAQQVRQAFPRAADERIYAFTDAIGDRRLPMAMATLRRLLDQGDEPLVIFGSLVAHVRRLLRARPYADQSASAVGNALGLPSWRAERLQRQARSYREDELVDALQVLATTDVEMKGGDIPPAAALETAVVEIVEGRA